MLYKKTTKTENKLQKTIQTAKIKLDRLRKSQNIIQEIESDFFFDWLNS